MQQRVCRHFNSERGCAKGEACPFDHIRAPTAEALRNNNSVGHDHDEQDKTTGADNAAHHHASNNHERRRNRHHADVDAASSAAIATTIEVVSAGVCAVVNLAQAPEEVVAGLMTLPPSSSEIKQDTSSASSLLLLALDFHGVTDIVPEDELIVPTTAAGDVRICVVSYVGAFGGIRDRTRESIQRRIASGQVHMGVLVFKKLQNPHDPDAPPDYFVASKRDAVERLWKYNNKFMLSTTHQHQHRHWSRSAPRIGEGAPVKKDEEVRRCAGDDDHDDTKQHEQGQQQQNKQRHQEENSSSSSSLIMKNNTSGAISRVLFVDDGETNVQTVKTTRLESVRSEWFRGKTADELRVFLMERMK